MYRNTTSTRSATFLVQSIDKIMVISAAAVLLTAAPANAVPQSDTQQSCINALNKAGHKVLRTQGRETSTCVRLESKGLLTITFSECLQADAKQKVAKARNKTVAAQAKSCSELPTLAYGGSDAVNVSAVDEERALADDILNTIIDAAADKVAAKCQALGVKSYEKLSAAFVKDFNSCKRATLADNASEPGQIEACIGAYAKSKIQRAEQKLLDTLNKTCTGVELGATVGGTFGSACFSGDSASVCAAKMIAAVRCRDCRAIAGMDALTSAVCDAVDNGIVDGSCTQCGNGILEIEAGELCDDGNNVDGDCCDSQCVPETGTAEGPQGDSTCSDTLDNDCDGFIDGLDPSCADPICPVAATLLGLAETSRQTCASNTDCSDHSGLCDPGLGRCVSASHLEFGYTGVAHAADTLDLSSMRLTLACVGPGPTCGECAVAGVDAAAGSCRCANDNRTVCDEPFANDVDDCGGAECRCYIAPPTPHSSGNTPTCWWPRLAEQVTGTVNVDSGELNLTLDQAVLLYLGNTLLAPCPYCDGDLTANDGNRDGTCVFGNNAGESCDVNAWSASLPHDGSAPLANAGASHDCAPDPGKNISGTGTRSTIPLSTAPAQSLPAAIPCGFKGFAEYMCPCSVCNNDVAQACSSNSDCTGGGECAEFLGFGRPMPNECASADCTDIGGGVGECATGPDDSFCDGTLRANGEPIVACLGDPDCAPGSLGFDAGSCAITRRRSCFLDPIVSGGSADPSRPVTAALFCDAHDAQGGGVQTVLGMPGPTRLVRENIFTSVCSDLVTDYAPGVGGCP